MTYSLSKLSSSLQATSISMTIYPSVLQAQDLLQATNLIMYIPPSTTLGTSTLTE